MGRGGCSCRGRLLLRVEDKRSDGSAERCSYYIMAVRIDWGGSVRVLQVERCVWG